MQEQGYRESADAMTDAGRLIQPCGVGRDEPSFHSTADNKVTLWKLFPRGRYLVFSGPLKDARGHKRPVFMVRDKASGTLLAAYEQVRKAGPWMRFF